MLMETGFSIPSTYYTRFALASASSFEFANLTVVVRATWLTLYHLPWIPTKYLYALLYQLRRTKEHNLSIPAISSISH